MEIWAKVNAEIIKRPIGSLIIGICILALIASLHPIIATIIVMLVGMAVVELFRIHQHDDQVIKNLRQKIREARTGDKPQVYN